MNTFRVQHHYRVVSWTSGCRSLSLLFGLTCRFTVGRDQRSKEVEQQHCSRRCLREGQTQTQSQYYLCPPERTRLWGMIFTVVTTCMHMDLIPLRRHSAWLKPTIQHLRNRSPLARSCLHVCLRLHVISEYLPYLAAALRSSPLICCKPGNSFGRTSCDPRPVRRGHPYIKANHLPFPLLFLHIPANRPAP